MNHPTPAQAPTSERPADAPPPAFVSTVTLLLCWGLVAACAALVPATDSPKKLPHRGASTSLSATAEAAPAPPVWDEFATASGLPANSANFAGGEWGAYPIGRETPSQEEDAPTF